MAEEKIKVRMEIDLPKELFKDFIQNFRDFDMKHDNGNRCHFEMTADCLTMPSEEIQAILRSITPPFQYEQVIPNDKIGKA